MTAEALEAGPQGLLHGGGGAVPVKQGAGFTAGGVQGVGAPGGAAQ